jgi:hypothetical protein
MLWVCRIYKPITIDNVSTVYSVDINQIKSKNNLIFNTNAYKQKKTKLSPLGLHAVQEKS